MLQPKQTEYGHYVHTIVAYRRKENDRWEMTFFPYEEKDIAEALAQGKIDCEEYRIVFWYATMLGLGNIFYKQHAINCGWIPDYDAHYWNAPGEAVPEYPDQSCPGQLEIELDSISYGWLRIAVRSTTSGETILIFDHLTDPLVGLARLTDNIRNGREGHTAVADDAFYMAFQVWNRPNGLSRLRVRSYNRIIGRETNETVDVLMDREAVVSMFEKLLRDIANHPDFGYQYACYSDLDNGQYDEATNAAEQEWDRLVSAGEVSADDEAARQDLECRYVRERVSLTSDNTKYIGKYIRMLTTYQIPDGWR